MPLVTVVKLRIDNQYNNEPCIGCKGAHKFIECDFKDKNRPFWRETHHSFAHDVIAYVGELRKRKLASVRQGQANEKVPQGRGNTLQGRDRGIQRGDFSSSPHRHDPRGIFYRQQTSRLIIQSLSSRIWAGFPSIPEKAMYMQVVSFLQHLMLNLVSRKNIYDKQIAPKYSNTNTIGSEIYYPFLETSLVQS